MTTITLNPIVRAIHSDTYSINRNVQLCIPRHADLIDHLQGHLNTQVIFR